MRALISNCTRACANIWNCCARHNIHGDNNRQTINVQSGLLLLQRVISAPIRYTFEQSVWDFLHQNRRDKQTTQSSKSSNCSNRGVLNIQSSGWLHVGLAFFTFKCIELGLPMDYVLRSWLPSYKTAAIFIYVPEHSSKCLNVKEDRYIKLFCL
jgi:hypothetical protein